MAARQASTVSASGSRISRRPTSRHADAGDRDPVLELVGDDHRPRLRTRSRPRPASGPGSGSSHVGANTGTRRRRCCSNCTATRMPDVRRRRDRTPTMLVVRRTRSSSSSATIAIEYGGGIVGQPLVHVLGAADDGAASRHLDQVDSRRAAVRAHGHRREQQRTARDAALHPEHPVAARRPVVLVLGRDVGERADRGGGVGVGHRGRQYVSARGARPAASRQPTAGSAPSCWSMPYMSQLTQFSAIRASATRAISMPIHETRRPVGCSPSSSPR